MAVKNFSDKTKTIADYKNNLHRDIWNSNKFSTIEVYDNGYEITNLSILNDYYNYLSNFLVEIPLLPKYYFKPNLFAKEYYGTDALDFLVLYFAGLNSPLEFNKTTIKVFPSNLILELNKLILISEERIEKINENRRKNAQKLNETKKLITSVVEI